jgi:hypothetical protein
VGLSNKEVLSFASGLKTIPGAMDSFIQTGSGANNVIDTLTGTMRLMSGAGVSQTEVINDLDVAYEKLSQSTGKVTDSAQKGAEFLADVSEIANTLGLRFADVRKVLDDVAGRFEFIGNETDGASRALGRYVSALQETGLTGKASLDIVNKMTDSLAGMTTGTKAFLSLRNGGPGGLQGAFQIDQMLRQGKIDEVLKMTERNLRQQFGGRIFTQAEAASSPEAASQFMRQRSLLQSGAFGVGKGLGDDQATRLLEALGKGDIGAATKDLKTGQDAVARVSERGAGIQQANNNELKMLNRQTEKIAMASQLTALTLSKEFLGTSGTQAEAITKQMGLAQEKAFASTNEAQKPIGPETFDQTMALAGRSIAAGLTESLGGVAKGTGGILGREAERTSELFKALGEATTNMKSNTQSTGLPPEAAKISDHYTSPAQSDRRQALLAHTTQAARSQQQDHVRTMHQAASTVAKAAEVSRSTATGGKGAQDKVTIELVLPAGMNATVKGDSDNVDLQIQRLNHNSMMPGSSI